jgi:cbb3-type cytochrome oxidase subunit 3
MSETMFGWVAGISTLVSMLAFLGTVAWSMSRRRTGDFEAAARLPLEEDDGTSGAQS